MKNSIGLENSSLEVEKVLSELGPKPYSHGDLKKFTSNFSECIGFGGYGEVYKGRLSSGVHIAVKILAKKDVVEETFMAEVMTMGKAYHRNLVKLYGYCYEHNIKALVYEYMENGSLDKILYEDHLANIEWERLYSIVIETAKGLVYLHDGWDDQIIHHDIKASNVLLDNNFSPKITDFGLAKLMKRDVSRVPLTRIRGSIGYNAPETWMPGSHVTHKCDVYSFGMMLFEVLGKRRNGEGENWFPQQVWDKFINGQLSQIINDNGIAEKDSDKAKILSMVALWCSQYTPEIRPSMTNVVLMLEEKIPVGVPPYPFQFGQSLESSLVPLPPTLKVIPTVDASLPVKNGLSSYFSRKLSGIFGSKKSLQLVEAEKSVSSSTYGSQQPSSNRGNQTVVEGIRLYKLEELLGASAEMLGKGQFGSAYKAVLYNGDVVCVKRLNIIQIGNDKREAFEQYMRVLGKLWHSNIVSLKGYHFGKDEKMLVYDFIPNGSLFSLLHETRGFEWTRRLKMAAGVARGLSFIHHYTAPSQLRRLSHGNIKSSNVLIDSTGNPRLTDFDLSPLGSVDVTTRSNGYCAPEALIEGRMYSQQKADIYAFGVLLMEILTGKNPIKKGGDSELFVNLPRWVESRNREERETDVFDSSLTRYKVKGKEDEMVKLLRIGMLCTCLSPEQRPSIDRVMNMIEEIRGVGVDEVSPSPSLRRAFSSHA
ncbi:Pr5-like receptor kinase [Thalictrum thalictroides]|uniref:Pr5-like receptor kinase n=1 Tax=Thalictrum thalictroides TaxID=46969 RepID=A0A7J6VNC5_THATH|nr:Pr5-like receptor kinase [Thalictrum thalictroides]